MSRDPAEGCPYNQHFCCRRGVFFSPGFWRRARWERPTSVGNDKSAEGQAENRRVFVRVLQNKAIAGVWHKAIAVILSVYPSNRLAHPLNLVTDSAPDHL